MAVQKIGVIPGRNPSALLAIAADPSLIAVGTITRNTDGVATAFGVVWPDGDTGQFTATNVSAFGVNAYTLTKNDGTQTITYTQSLMTRNIDGAVTNRPALTVS